MKAQITAGTTAESEQASLRIVSTVDSLNYQEAGFYIQIEGKEKVNKIPCNTVFTRIVAAENGVAFDYQPSIFSSDSTYFMTYTINNIPNANFGTNISVTPYWITLDGTEVKGATSVKNVNMGISGT